jgi:hypothetical protein
MKYDNVTNLVPSSDVTSVCVNQYVFIKKQLSGTQTEKTVMTNLTPFGKKVCAVKTPSQS